MTATTQETTEQNGSTPDEQKPTLTPELLDAIIRVTRMILCDGRSYSLQEMANLVAQRLQDRRVEVAISVLVQARMVMEKNLIIFVIEKRVHRGNQMNNHRLPKEMLEEFPGLTVD